MPKFNVGDILVLEYSGIRSKYNTGQVLEHKKLRRFGRIDKITKDTYVVYWDDWGIRFQKIKALELSTVRLASFAEQTLYRKTHEV